MPAHRWMCIVCAPSRCRRRFQRLRPPPAPWRAPRPLISAQRVVDRRATRHDLETRYRRRLSAGRAARGARAGRAAGPARPLDGDRRERQVLRLRHRQRPAGLDVRRRLDLAPGGQRDAGGARRQARPRGARPRRQQHLGAGHDPRRRQVLPLLLGAGHAAEVGDRAARRQDARSRARPTTNGRTAGRSSGPTASRTATRSIPASFAIRPTARCG